MPKLQTMGRLNRTSRYMVGFVGIILLTLPHGDAKSFNGGFQLSSKKTDHVIASFSIAAGATGIMTAVLLSPTKYPKEDNLKMHLYRDDDWQRAKSAKTCQEKAQYARKTEQVQFKLESDEQVSAWGHNKRRYRAENQLQIETAESDIDYVPRHHYWYITYHDCSMDGRSTSQTSTMKYYVQIYNKLSENAYTHLSTDEFGVSRIHTITMFLSGTVCFLLFSKIVVDLTTCGIVHIAKFMVMGAAAFDTASSAFELLHMYFYRFDGVGFYTLDSLSAYNEALCDAIVCFLLVAIAAGWTLPSDVIAVKNVEYNATLIQNILAGLANPAGSKSWMNPFTGMLFGLTASHLSLAHWGLLYNDDFDSYHDLEHLPGKILMIFRFALGIFLLVAVAQTRNKCRTSLHSFYKRFAVVGMLWFQGLPAITWFCNSFVAFHQRHPTVVIAGAILQSTSLVLLSWLVACGGSSSSYHKVSHMTQRADDNLTEKMARTSGTNPCTWNLIGKTKIRLD